MIDPLIFRSFIKEAASPTKILTSLRGYASQEARVPPGTQSKPVAQENPQMAQGSQKPDSRSQAPQQPVEEAPKATPAYEGYTRGGAPV